MDPAARVRLLSMDAEALGHVDLEELASLDDDAVEWVDTTAACESAGSTRATLPKPWSDLLDMPDAELEVGVCLEAGAMVLRPVDAEVSDD